MKSILSLLLSVAIIMFGAVADADITQVTTNSYEDILPRIRGNYLVWQGRSNGDWEIFLYNISTGTNTQITDNNYDDLSPQTDGKCTVWQGFDDGEWDIFLWDGTQTQAISGSSAEDTGPEIANGLAVWTSQPFGEDFVGHSEVILYDAGTQTSTVLSAGVDPGNTLDDSGPNINEEAVIWVQADDQDNTTVYMYDLSSGTITGNPDYVWRDRPHRDGNLSVLTRHDGQDREIFLYNGDSRRYHQVTDNSLQDRYPNVSEPYIAWMADGEIFLAGLPLIAKAATNLRQRNFTANWNAPAEGADSYRLDVSTESDFNSYVAGYQNLDVGNRTSYSVTGLMPGTTYFYRVRSVLGGSTSENSDTISVKTLRAKASPALYLLLLGDEEPQSPVIIRR